MRSARPFDPVAAGHVLVRTAEELGWDLGDVGKFAKRAQHIEFGLSAELEFAALLRWLGKCSFVHRLSEDAFRDAGRAPWETPDLLAFFDHGGRRQCVLIEVKTTQTSALPFTTEYLEKLGGYARELGHPLLIAWKPRDIGMWFLVDPAHATCGKDGRPILTLDAALKNDLMGLLAGDFYVVPSKGAGLRFVAKRVGAKTPTETGYFAEYVVTEAGLHDAKGNRHPSFSEPLFWLIASQMETIDDVQDDRVVRSFVASGGVTRAQLALRTALAFPLSEGERVHWREVASDRNILQRDALLAEAQSAFGTYVDYVLHMRPQAVPQFLEPITGLSWTEGGDREGRTVEVQGIPTS